MSGWWHPEGPESVATYWSRRLVVIVTAVLVAVLAVVVLTNGARGSEPQAAGPESDAPVTSPAPNPSQSPSQSPTSTADSSGPTSGSTPSGSATASSGESSSSGTSRASTSVSTPASSTASASSSASSSATSRPSASTPAAKPAAPAPCDPAALRATLQGDPTPKVGQRVVFTLSLINGGDRACTFKRNADTVELKVYSGTDRIWSTADCPTLVRPVAHLVRPEGSVEWKIAWTGARSAKGCKARPETPRPGTYFATFQFSGAKPVQQRMVLSAP